MHDAQAKRARIEASLQHTPGQGLRALQRRTGIPHGTLRHHLDFLGRRGRVWWLRLGNRFLHFTGGRPHTGRSVLDAVVLTFDQLDGQAVLAHPGRWGPMPEGRAGRY